MADPQDDEPTRSTAAPGDGGDGAPGVTVNWRGIVDADAPEPKSARIVHSTGRAVGGVLTALGLKRKRLPDGSLAPRPWGRIAVIWGGLVVLLLLFSAGHVVSAGNVGVPVTLGSAGDPLDPGLHFTAPWPFSRVTEMSTRTQNYSMSSTRGEGSVSGDDSVIVLGRDGAQANVDATVLFRVNRENATRVYETLGTSFNTSVVRPSARSCIRTEFTSRDLVEASTASWPEISEAIADCMREKIEPRGITLEDFQLRDVRLSPQVQQAVEVGVAARETEGSQLSDAYLTFAYIQALRELANSPGSRTVVIPNGTNFTPTLPLDEAPSDGSTPTTAGQ
jgi:regulator of protease activity HflC (stomatin/prohibitin superfamily)